MKYFTNCNTAEDLKKEYRRLAKQLHPDLGAKRIWDFVGTPEKYTYKFRGRNLHQRNNGNTAGIYKYNQCAYKPFGHWGWNLRYLVVGIGKHQSTQRSVERIKIPIRSQKTGLVLPHRAVPQEKQTRINAWWNPWYVRFWKV